MVTTGSGKSICGASAERWRMLMDVGSSASSVMRTISFIQPQSPNVMKKLKHESELFKAALLAGVKYAEGRKAVEFEATDSASDKALYVYRLLVHDKVIAPMPEEQVSEKTIRHRLATWYAHQLPSDHPLND